MATDLEINVYALSDKYTDIASLGTWMYGYHFFILFQGLEKMGS